MASITRRPRAAAKTSKVKPALDKALESLLLEGASFTALSVDQLTTRAGLARSTFYLHYKDKGEYVQDLLASMMQETLEAAAPWLNHAAQACKDDVHAAVGNLVRHYHKRRMVFSAVVETATYDPLVNERFQAVIQALIQRVSASLNDSLVQSGKPAAPAQLAHALVWMLERCCYQLPSKASKARIDSAIEAVTHVIWTSIEACKKGE